MDQTTRDLPADGNPHRSRQKQVRAHHRKCALAPATDHPQAAGETASMHEDGSSAPCLLGKSGSDMEASTLDGPARSRPLLASEGFRVLWKHTSKVDFSRCRLRGYLQEPAHKATLYRYVNLGKQQQTGELTSPPIISEAS